MPPWYQRHCLLSSCSVNPRMLIMSVRLEEVSHFTVHGHHVHMQTSVKGTGEQKAHPFSRAETAGGWSSHSYLTGQNFLTWPSLAAGKAGNKVFPLGTMCPAKNWSSITIEEGGSKYQRVTSSLCHNIIFDYPQKEPVIGCGFGFGYHLVLWVKSGE